MASARVSRAGLILEPQKVSFRALVPEIPSSGYASHGMYYYPARFIPQVVRWTLDHYSSPGDWVVDPFAGSGTVGVESLLTGRNCHCLDLNPLLGPLLEAKTFRRADPEEMEKYLGRALQHRGTYSPPWSRIGYWHPPEFRRILARWWGYYHEHPKPLFLIALLRTTRKFSYADDVVPKLFKSRRKTREVLAWMRGDYRNQMEEFLHQSLREVVASSEDFARRYVGGELVAQGGTDLLEYHPDRRWDLVLTSPPYGIAHEYIRSVKLDLAWMGLGDAELRHLLASEIPYNRNGPELEIPSPEYRRYLTRLPEPARGRCANYFESTLYALGKILGNLRKGGHAALFVGNATFSGREAPYARIFAEHFGTMGFEPVALLEDTIRGRRLFRGRRNVSPDGIASEWLLIIRRT